MGLMNPGKMATFVRPEQPVTQGDQ
jgi:hypothetical protein